MASCSALPDRKARAWVDLDDASGSDLCDTVSPKARFGFLFSAIGSCVTQKGRFAQALAGPVQPVALTGRTEPANWPVNVQGRTRTGGLIAGDQAGTIEERIATMLRQILIAGTMALVAPPLSVVCAGTAAAAAVAPAFSTSDSSIGTLLDNPATKAILQKYLPDLVSNPQIEMARGMTLKQIQSYSADTVTDEVLAKIDADLAKVPAPK
ncbi:hypothetical protein [Sphingomonas sp. IC081]|uniref:hypothetical protein n=1 Tax=Sphingomonas sp. IC081 TaxID=304378 RepID=UPI0021AF59C8|nr:hypothetical protein [Sphingomonas sp. IC081]